LTFAGLESIILFIGWAGQATVIRFKKLVLTWIAQYCIILFMDWERGKTNV